MNITLPSLSDIQNFINTWQAQGANAGWSNTAFYTLASQTFPNISHDALTYLRTQSEAYKTQFGVGPSAQLQLNLLQQYYQSKGYTVNSPTGTTA